MPKSVLVAASAVLALAGLTVPATAEVAAPVYLEVGAGDPVLPGGKLSLSGSVGEGCREGEYKVFQEYWPQPGTTGSTVIEYRRDGAPPEGGDYLVTAPDGSFSAVVGVPGDATRSNLYGDRPGEVPHYVWVEVTGCETAPWKRASDRYGSTVPVQPVSMRTAMTATPDTLVAGEALTVTVARCHGAVAKAWAEVDGTEVPASSVTAAGGLVTVVFDVPEALGADPSAVATVLCTQSQTPDNVNSVEFGVRAAPAAADDDDGTGSGGSGSTGTVTVGSGGTGPGSTGSGAPGYGTAGGTGTASTVTAATAGTATRVAAPAKAVSGTARYAG